jgi:hypothetical protein
MSCANVTLAFAPSDIGHSLGAIPANAIHRGRIYRQIGIRAESGRDWQAIAMDVVCSLSLARGKSLGVMPRHLTYSLPGLNS